MGECIPEHFVEKLFCEFDSGIRHGTDLLFKSIVDQLTTVLIQVTTKGVVGSRLVLNVSWNRSDIPQVMKIYIDACFILTLCNFDRSSNLLCNASLHSTGSTTIAHFQKF